MRFGYFQLSFLIIIVLAITTTDVTIARIRNLAVVNLVQVRIENSGTTGIKAADKARNLFQEILDRVPGDLSSRRYLGLIAAIQDDDIQALNYWRQINLPPEDLIAWGQYEEGKGSFEEAHQWYRYAIALEPDVFEVWYTLGLFHRRQNDWQSAIEAQNRAVALMPKSRDAWYELAWAYMMIGQNDAAHTAFFEAKDASSNKIGLSIIYYYIGYLRQQLSTSAFSSEAWQAYERALNIDEYQTSYWQERNLKASTYYQRAKLLMNSARWQEAISECHLALDVDPQNYPTHLALAHALWQTNEHKYAKEVAEAAIELEPKRVNAYHVLGEFYYRERDFANAKGIYESILAIDPADQKAQKILSSIKS